MARIEYFYDYGSPYSYLADTQLPALLERTGAELVYRPMLLGGVFKATDNVSPFMEPVDAKRAYFGVELPRWIARLGVPFSPNRHFPINTLLLMRCAHAAEESGAFLPFHRAVFPAFWCEGQDMGDPEVIRTVLEKAGLDGGAILGAAAEPPAKDALRATTEEAVSRGVFGAPSFFVEDELFFGNDRLDFVERALAAGGGPEASRDDS